MRNSLRIAVTSGLGALAMIGLSACSSEGAGSAPIGKTSTETVTVIEMPNGYYNVAFTCFGTNGVYSSQGVEVVKDDPHCVQS